MQRMVRSDIMRSNSGQGKGNITLRRNELPAGIYKYALLVNGVQADVRQMAVE